MFVTLTACLLLVAADALPHHHQLLYQPGFQAHFYHPQQDVQGVHQYAAPRPVALPSQPGTTQYVLLYPGGGPQNNFLYGRADLEPRGADVGPRSPEDGEQRPPTIWNLFNVFQRPSTTPRIEAAEGDDVVDGTTVASPTSTEKTLTTTAATTVEETTPKPSSEATAKPEKFVTDNDETMLAVEQMASLENFDEQLPQIPEAAGSPSSDGRQFAFVQRPQFFGNYDFLNRNHMHQRFGIPPGGVSNFLLFRNGFVQPGTIPAPGPPLKLEQENVIPSVGFPVQVDALQTKEENVVPGSAALSFQQEFIAAQEQAHKEGDGSSTRTAQIPGSQHVDVSHILRQGSPPQLYFAPQVYPRPGYQNVFLVTPRQIEQAVVVDADKPRKDEAVLPEQAGPSVAQAKPQAIALAGVGGVAAASPVATAVVGPGGLAVSAPTATAVAGNSGGGALGGPAQAAVATVNKHITNNNKVKTKTRDDTSYDYTDEDRYNV